MLLAYKKSLIIHL